MSSRSHRRGADVPRLRVAYVVKRFPRLSETFVLNEILELERQGVDVHVLALRPPTNEPRHRLLSELRAPVTYLPSQSETRSDIDFAGLKAVVAGKTDAAVRVLAAQAASLAAYVWRHQIAHMHAHFSSDTTTVALVASRASGVPFSFTAHARDIYHTYVSPDADRAARRTKLRAAAFAVTVSDYNRRHLADIGGTDIASKIHRIYNGVDLVRFRFADAGREPGLVLSVGRLVEKKGFGDFVAALARLGSRGVRCRAVLAGDGPLRTDLERQAAELGIADRITFAGALPQDEVMALMRRAALLVLPCVVTASGDRDGLPTVLLEALASGLPAVSTDVAGISEIIDAEHTGLLVAPNAPDALGDAMARLLFEPDLARRFARAGREKAERNFDLAKSVGCLRELFAISSADHNTGRDLISSDADGR
jgi:colanic acid/amylovoran biosynthesis glycosyltransferase